jgi:hypothetical protein
MLSASSSNTAMDDSLDTIAAMRHQETTSYVTSDWLQLEQHESQMYVTSNGPLHFKAVDIECRNRVAAWGIQVADYCKFSRETVEIAMSCLDRFLASAEGTTARNDRNVYQLASMAALYTAIKIHEPNAMDPKSVARLSRGAFSPQEIEKMEAKLLHALKWRVNPPTTLSFVRKLLSLIPEQVLHRDLRGAVFDLTRCQTEFSISTYQLVPVAASTVAYSALMISLESLGLGLGDKVVSNCSHIFSQALQVDCDSSSFCQCPELRESYTLQATNAIIGRSIPVRKFNSLRRQASPRVVVSARR